MTQNPMRKGHIFISYARGDGSKFALQLYDDLETRHINAWLDVYDIGPGDDFYSAIDRGLKGATTVVVILTPLAVMSAQVRSEWNSALNLHIPIIPLLVLTCEVPAILNIFNWIDFRTEYDAGIAALRRRISRLYEDHLAYLNEQLDGYRAAQSASTEPEGFQPKIDDLVAAISRWEKLFAVEQQVAEQKTQKIEAITLNEGYLKSMDQIFVGRKRELQRLDIFLRKSLSSEMQVCLIEGEAGSGKSTLLHEFARHAQDANDKLLFVIGNCNTQTGISDPYLPFRQILSLLTGDVDAQLAAGQITDQNAQRLRDIFKVSGRTLVELAPELIGTLLPGASLVVSLARLAARERGLLKGLEERAEKAEKQKFEIDQSQILFQYTAFLRNLSKESPLVIVLDDLHWADTASIGLFFHLTRELKNSRILLIGLYRPNDLAAGRGGERHPLEPTLLEIKSYYRDIAINLDEIKHQEGRAFIDSFIDTEPNTLDESFRATLFQRTDGHPLFTVELLRSMQDSGDLIKDEVGRWGASPNLDWNNIPAIVEAVIEERIERLASGLREMLTVASVEGQDFTVKVLARLQQANERDLLRNLSRELEKRHQLIHEAGDIKIADTQLILSRYTFSHALFQRYLYNSLGRGEKRLLHADVAAALEELYAGRTDTIVPQLARHYAEAGNTEKAVEYLKQAGEKAFQVAALKEARDLFQQALNLLDAADIRNVMRSQIEWLIGEAYYSMSRYDASKPHFQSCLDLAQQLTDENTTAKAFVSLGASLWQTHNYKVAQEFLEKGLSLAIKNKDRSLESRARRILSAIFREFDQMERAIEYSEKALELAVEVDSPELQTACLNGLALIYYTVLGDFRKAITNFEKALKIATSTNNITGQALYSGNLAAYHQLGEYERARGYLKEALKLNLAIDQTRSQAHNYMELGWIAFRLEDYSVAFQHFERAQQITDEDNHFADSARSRRHLALCYLHADQLEPALKLIVEAYDIASQHNALGRNSVESELLLQAVIYARLGRSSEAFAIFAAESKRANSECKSTKRWAAKYHYALALAGMAFFGSMEERLDLIAQSVDAYQAAISYCNARGVCADALLLFRELRKADPSGLLIPVELVLEQAIL
jgi:adenylate cyclase